MSWFSCCLCVRQPAVRSALASWRQRLWPLKLLCVGGKTCIWTHLNPFDSIWFYLCLGKGMKGRHMERIDALRCFERCWQCPMIFLSPSKRPAWWDFCILLHWFSWTKKWQLRDILAMMFGAYGDIFLQNTWQMTFCLNMFDWNLKDWDIHQDHQAKTCNQLSCTLIVFYPTTHCISLWFHCSSRFSSLRCMKVAALAFALRTNCTFSTCSWSTCFFSVALIFVPVWWLSFFIHQLMSQFA